MVCPSHSPHNRKTIKWWFYNNKSGTRKVVAVVGVGKGIGGAVALKFAKEGFNVAILARNQTYSGADKLSPLKKEIESLGEIF